jgi:hypothetical protein
MIITTDGYFPLLSFYPFLNMFLFNPASLNNPALRKIIVNGSGLELRLSVSDQVQRILYRNQSSLIFSEICLYRPRIKTLPLNSIGFYPLNVLMALKRRSYSNGQKLWAEHFSGGGFI